MIKVRVPATSANMGPGFDSIGMAVKLYNEFAFREINNGLNFNGVPEEFCNEDNIIYKAMKYCFDKADYKFKGLNISVLNQDIPISRGLGSSSSCIVGGLVGANEILGGKFSKDELLEMAVEIEGHPDNVAPALFGGMVVAIIENNKTVYNKIEIKDKVKFITIVPDFRLSTEKARKVLPKQISRADGIYNIGRAALMISCFVTDRYDLIRSACNDALHQNYRKELIPHFDDVYNKCYELGALGCYLSGAGPTIMAIIDNGANGFSNNIKQYLKDQDVKWGVLELQADNKGAFVIKGDS
ncbi:homoserine kinase [Clostridium botulinum]|uniref:homoserine kinase n=1 Tax=unclassified Clostridium TaxID=2614128 RepID=UPI0005018B96|nr:MULTISPECIES: homoserine kinase [unclassified Clostridium]AIY78784.1 homoserine kinase [Clostridium botulinum 202F]KAI3347849.1 homoserine kinase [Clostridium botulinum]KFX53947.1 serine kinase [Clostridium botulinum]KFX57062.1 serine kinase [Clostridium botulinum]KON14600.1 serine kinase [Clostridium botulinum]